MQLFRIICLLLPCFGFLLSSTGSVFAATEYFVSRQGDDTNDGRNRSLAFRTIQRGVNALAEGDTLVILPGEYRETVHRRGLGGPDHDTRIRAEIPGTVLLRGDVPAPPFVRVPGFRFVYVADFEQPVQAINNAGTLSMLSSAGSINDVEAIPGTFYFDPAQKRLYASTLELQQPLHQNFTVSILDGFGLYLEQARRVIIEGLAATGFNSAGIKPDYPGYRTNWGIAIAKSVDCVIQDCVAYLNGGGLMIRSGADGGGNQILRGRAWANGSRHGGEGGNILVFEANNDRVRDSFAHSSRFNGIRLYGAGATSPSSIENSVAWGNGADLAIKGGALHQLGKALNSVAVGNVAIDHVHHCLVGGYNQKHRVKEIQTPEDTIMLARETALDPDHEFADPENVDFRPQPGSRFRAGGLEGAARGPYQYEANIFYVRPDGDDDADGLSLAAAWRTPSRAARDLRQGDTLYLSPGTYHGGLVVVVAGDAPVHIRGRGTETPLIHGPVRVNGAANVTFERLRLAGPVQVADSRRIAFAHCELIDPQAGLVAERVDGLRVEHVHFPTSGLTLTACRNVYLAGNLYAGTADAAVRVDDVQSIVYADYNMYANPNHAWRIGERRMMLDALRPTHENHATAWSVELRQAAVGPFGTRVGPHRFSTETTMRVAGPFLHAVTDTTANIEWWTSRLTTCELSWQSDENELGARRFDANGFTSFSLTDLQPDTEYRFRVRLPEPYVHTDGDAVSQADVEISFRTAKRANEPVEYFVAPNGDDDNSGRSREQALRTVNAAAALALAGDTVWIAEGRYRETVRVRATGTEGRPVTFRSLPGEKVVFDGDDRALSRAFQLTAKHHVHFDGLYFTGYGGGLGRPWTVGTNGMITVYHGRDVRITRCFNDGKGRGYPPRFVAAWQSPNMVIRNCAITIASGLDLNDCPDLRIENNVFLVNMIHAYSIVNAPQDRFYFNNNIVTDSLAIKNRVMLFEVGRVESLVERDNAYFLRLSDEEKRMFMFYGNVAYQRAAEHYQIPVATDDAPVFTELVRMGINAYHEKFGDTGSVIVNPAFRGAEGLENATDRHGNPMFMPDAVAWKRNLDFPDLFTTNPMLMERKIGLEPEAFTDFHFARPTGSHAGQ